MRHDLGGEQSQLPRLPHLVTVPLGVDHTQARRPEVLLVLTIRLSEESRAEIAVDTKRKQ